MPLKTKPRKGGRRGRPRKHVQTNLDSAVSHSAIAPAATTSHAQKSHAAMSTHSSTHASAANRPREERSFKDFFPNLDIKAPLPIVRIRRAPIKDASTPPPPPSGSPTTPCSSSMTLTQQQAGTSSDEFCAGSSDLSSLSDLVADESSPEERNADPLIDHHKTGDTFQALSTRPQPSQPGQPLPKPSFRKVSETTEHKADGNDSDNSREDSVELSHRFKRPENHYIRYIEPSEADLFETVEYDMDEQDEAWLQMLNEERQKENAGQVTPDMFEAIMDQLEKEWFDLVKNLPKQSTDEPSLPEDSPCAICDDTECENSNAIVFCDGCNLAVHQDCYGIPYIPEGQWLCRKCLVSPENPVSCLFCPNEGGAFKQTNTNKWGHLLCAIWIPEVGLSNSVYMEPIDNIEDIPKSRWKLTCYLCRRRQGACIQCDNKHCFAAFHVTCARWARLCMRMKSHGAHYDSVCLKAYCDKHTPRDYREQENVEQNVLAAQAYFSNIRRKSHRSSQYGQRELEQASSGSDTDQPKRVRLKKRRRNPPAHPSPAAQLLPNSKAARAHQHHYSAGAPIAPEYIIHKLENVKLLKQATHLQKKSQLLTSISRYWSLKRESRRGAPLLKRLHLEPWTASSQHKQNEVEKARRAKAMMNLRSDLELVRMLSEQVQKREKLKLERLRKQKLYLEMILFPAEYIARPIIEQLMEADKKDLFQYPVTPDVAADYAEVIEHPICFSDILQKLSAHVYTGLEAIHDDISLVWKNSMQYNKPDTTYYKLAQKLEKMTNELMKTAYKDFAELEISKATGTLAVDIHPEIFTYNMVQVPSPEEMLAEQQRLAEQEKAKAAEEEKKRLAAEKSEARKLQEAARKQARAEAAEKRRKLREAQSESRRAAAKDTGTVETPAHSGENASAAPSGVTTVHPPTTTTSKSKQPTTRRRTRSMGSEGLLVPTPEHLQKRSGEARKLVWLSDRPVEEVTYKADRKRKAPPGWLYLEDDEDGTSDEENKDDEAKQSTATPAPKHSPKKPKRSTGILNTSREPPVQIQHQQMVWARVKGFPPHPANVVDPDQQEVPPKVLNARPSGDMVLVEFYKVPEMHRWGWIARSDVHAFGHPELDTEMLMLARKKKNSHRVKEIQKGYAYACELAGLDPQPQIDAAFPKR